MFFVTDDLPEFLKSGERVRLFSVVSEGSRERRAASAFLSGLIAIPDLSREVLATVGVRVGPRTSIEAYTEVVFSNEKQQTKDRPDGLLIVSTGRQTWSALIEAKIGNVVLDEDQIKRYAELARDQSIDAVITVTNQFVARPDHHPVKLTKALANRVKLFHWSWTFIQTQAYLLDLDGEISDPSHALLLHEFVRFLTHPSTGVARFDAMNREWRDVVRTVQTGGVLPKSSEAIENTIGSWHQETRDLCLLMSRIVGRAVHLKLSRAHRETPTERAREDCQQLAEHKTLSCTIEIPDAANDLCVIADLQRRTITCSMELRAPEDRARTSARVNWLLRQLGKTTDQDILVKAKWPGRSPDTQDTLSRLRGDPSLLQASNSKMSPRAFEVAMIRDLAGKFSGSRNFIEHLEGAVPVFYEQVGQYLKQWHPAPPKPRTIKVAEEEIHSSDEASEVNPQGHSSEPRNLGS